MGPGRPDQLDSTVARSADADDMVGTVADAGAPASLDPGRAVGRYVVLERIGAGGMGVVYKAYDPEIDRAVALKILRPRSARSEQSQARLLREAVALGRLSHPNVVTIHDVGTCDDGVFIAMELVSGPNLATWLADEPRTVQQIIDTFLAAGRGLQAAHESGLVHRDFKPANAVIGDDGRVRVLDFGLARDESDPPDSARTDEAARAVGLTVTGAVIGTPRFMAPEQLDGLSADERSDQFSYCVSLWWALYGEPPFHGDSLPELAEAIATTRPTPPARPRVEVPARIRDLLLTGLQPTPQDRHPSLAVLLDELERDPGRRRRRILTLAGAGLTGAALAGLLLIVTGDSGPAEPCATAGDRATSVWGSEVAGRLRDTFRATGSPIADATADRVTSRLNDYTERWAARRVETCEATRVHGTQSEELLDLRMSCLDRRLGDVAALVDVFVDEPGAPVVANAVAATYQLADLSICDDADALRATVPRPTDAETRARLDRLEERIQAQQALLRAGRYEQLLAASDALERQAAAIGYAPAEAQLLLVHGEARAQIVDLDAAVATLRRAVRVAADARDDLVAARAWTWLIALIGVLQNQPNAALTHRLAAEAAAARADDPEATIWLLSSLGGVLLARGDRREAGLLQQRAAGMLDQSRDPVQRAAIRNNLGAHLQAADRLDEARVEYRRAAADARATLGEVHPFHAFALVNEGTVSTWLGEPSDGLQACSLAVSVYRQLHPDGGAETARALTCEAAALVALDRADDAIARLSEAEAMATAESRPEFVARRKIVHARALIAAGSDRERALALADEALAFYRSSPETPASVLAAMESWRAAQQ